jgi:RHS repeat-associated protein
MLNMAFKQRLSYKNRRNNFTGKELDPETGLYYYGARYLDPKTSRWLSGEPAMGEYFPVAPINDDAKKHNQNLPGQGGVFNYVNLHAYHYAGNNPIKYIDPDGEVSEEVRVTEENYTKSKLRDMISSPEKYIIKSYVRKALVAYPGNRFYIVRHSFYIIINVETNDTFTLSFNGSIDNWPFSKGYWLINSDKDRKSISTPEKVRTWAVEQTTPESGIDVIKTAKNILKRIEDSEIKYNADKEIFKNQSSRIDNCNTALEATIESK